MKIPITNLDLGVQNILGTQNTILIVIFLAITHSIYLLFLLEAYLLYKKNKISANFTKFFLAIILIFIVTGAFKYFFERERPNLSGENSFPSRHAALAAAMALFWPIKSKWKKSFVWAWAFLVCLSRIILNLHWFSDVIAGALLGLCFAHILEKINFEKIIKKLKFAKKQ